MSNSGNPVGLYRSMAARDLLEECNEAMSLGLDFPMLWHSVIKPHEAVAGIPLTGRLKEDLSSKFLLRDEPIASGPGCEDCSPGLMVAAAFDDCVLLKHYARYSSFFRNGVLHGHGLNHTQLSRALKQHCVAHSFCGNIRVLLRLSAVI